MCIAAKRTCCGSPAALRVAAIAVYGAWFASACGGNSKSELERTGGTAAAGFAGSAAGLASGGRPSGVAGGTGADTAGAPGHGGSAASTGTASGGGAGTASAQGGAATNGGTGGTAQGGAGKPGFGDGGMPGLGGLPGTAGSGGTPAPQCEPLGQPLPSCSDPPGCTTLTPGTVAIGVQHSCALVGDGTAKCWGSNDYGQLGSGDIGGISQAASVAGLNDISTLAATDYGTCALTSAGGVYCWGLGPNDTNAMPGEQPGTPHALTGFEDITMIATGTAHLCALRSDGKVLCTGVATDAVGGTESVNVVSGIENATFVAAGHDHSCAILADGSVKCWGSNQYGQLGNPKATSTAVPVAVESVSGARVLALGREFSCAITTNFSVTCWGTDFPPSLEDVVGIAAREGNACFAKVGGTVYCFGEELATESGVRSGLCAATIPGFDLAELAGLAVSPIHACAVVGEGAARAAWCWGNAKKGQLGTGSSNGGGPERVPLFP